MDKIVEFDNFGTLGKINLNKKEEINARMDGGMK